VLSRSVAQVNSALMLHADTPLPGADLARAAGLSYTPAMSALKTLEKRGIARRTRRAERDEFEPDKRSPYFPMAYGVALVDLPLQEAFRGQRVHMVYAYGSLAAPGGGTRESDLDLFIVGDIKDRNRLLERTQALGARLNRLVDPFILSPEQFERARRRRDEHVASALAGVRLIGGL
jgi:DNA-binding Lrp family transcriptional regulator